jgi:hypothetical protein
MSRFIYVKEKSLTPSLTSKILEVYNTLCVYNDCIYNGTNEFNIPTVCNVLLHTKNYEKTNEQYSFLLKLRQKLGAELKENFYKYLLEISTQNNIEYNKIMGFNINFEKNDYIINNRYINTNNIVEKEHQFPEIGQTRHLRICKYIWFLTDYNGEIQICNTKLTPKKGTLLMYPISWVCPVIENINKGTDIYVLYGYINHHLKQKN